MFNATFDVDAFLAEPRQVQLATNGPTIRTLDYQWEDGCFWILSGPWAKLLERVRKDPKVALIVDTTEYDTGRIYQVTAYGDAEITPFDLSRARRMLERYMGRDQSTWSTAPTDYPGYLRDGGPPGAVWLKIRPKKFVAYNFSYLHSPYAPR
jgi:nitroimidazol reductase NimA-like FMN-containing flavoprotein (pyridoxamine 5'-phosphate oxidase superfamily)